MVAVQLLSLPFDPRGTRITTDPILQNQLTGCPREPQHTVWGNPLTSVVSACVWEEVKGRQLVSVSLENRAITLPTVFSLERAAGQSESTSWNWKGSYRSPRARKCQISIVWSNRCAGAAWALSCLHLKPNETKPCSSQNPK